MNKNLRYHVVFVDANGSGPYLCFFCGEGVPDIDNRGRGRGHLSTEGCVHHIDGDHSNNEVDNLAPAHQGCHTTHHMLSNNKAKLMSDIARENGNIGKMGGANSFGRDRDRAAEMGRLNGPANGKKWSDICQITTCGFESNLGNVTQHTKKCGCEVVDSYNRSERVKRLETHCRAGHEFTEENTYVGVDGRRTCRACNAQYQRDKRQAKKEGGL